MKKDSKMKKAMLLATATVAGTGPIISSVPNVYAQEVTLVDENTEEEITQEETIINEENAEEENNVEKETIVNEEETVEEDEVTEEIITEEQEDSAIEEVTEKAVLNDSSLLAESNVQSTEEYITIDEEHFLDEDFREWVQKWYDTDSDGKLSSEERDSNIAYSTATFSSTANFNDLTGIEYLTGLTTIKIEAYSGTEIDLSKLTKLQTLTIGSDVTTLKDLKLGTSNTSLTTLSVQSSSVENIEGLENLTSLTSLTLSNTKIESIDVSRLTNLTSLNVSGITNLTTITGHEKLTELTSLNISNTGIGILDVSSLTKLTTLDVSNTSIEILDLSNNTALTSLTASSGNEALKTIKLSSSATITTLDLSGATSLEVFEGNGANLGGITSISIAGAKASNSLLASLTGLTTLTITGWSEETEIDLTKNTALTSVSLLSLPEGVTVNFSDDVNKITTMDFSGTPLVGEGALQTNKSKDEFTGLTTLKLNQTGIVNFSAKELPESVTKVTINNTNTLESINIEEDSNLAKLYVNSNSNLSDVTIMDNEKLEVIILYDCGKIGDDGLHLDTSYKNLKLLSLKYLGLTSFTAPTMEFKSPNESNYWAGNGDDIIYRAPTLIITENNIKSIDVSKAGNLAGLELIDCIHLEEIVGLENTTNLNRVITMNCKSLKYLDLSNININSTYNYVGVDGSGIVYLNLPEGSENASHFQVISSNLSTLEFDAEVGGYDAEKGYWIDLSEIFPGIILDRISDIKDKTTQQELELDLKTGRIYGVTPGSPITYTYALTSSSNAKTISPIINPISVTLTDGGKIPVGETGFEVVVPSGSIVQSDGSIVITNGGEVTIPGVGTVEVSAGSVIEADGTIVSEESIILANGIEIPSGNTVKIDGTVIITNDGNITVPGLGTVEVSAGTIIDANGTITSVDGDEEDNNTTATGNIILSTRATVTLVGGYEIEVPEGSIINPTDGVITISNGGKITLSNGESMQVEEGTKIDLNKGFITLSNGDIISLGNEESEGNSESNTDSSDENSNNTNTSTGSTSTSGGSNNTNTSTGSTSTSGGSNNTNTSTGSTSTSGGSNNTNTSVGSSSTSGGSNNTNISVGSSSTSGGSSKTSASGSMIITTSNGNTYVYSEDGISKDEEVSTQSNEESEDAETTESTEEDTVNKEKETQQTTTNIDTEEEEETSNGMKTVVGALAGIIIVLAGGFGILKYRKK